MERVCRYGSRAGLPNLSTDDILDGITSCFGELSCAREDIGQYLWLFPPTCLLYPSSGCDNQTGLQTLSNTTPSPFSQNLILQGWSLWNATSGSTFPQGTRRLFQIPRPWDPGLTRADVAWLGKWVEGEGERRSRWNRRSKKRPWEKPLEIRKVYLAKATRLVTTSRD